jgi:glyoxylase-like metal-dependent hydrolase (beta-lactamase superfamily II)
VHLNIVPKASENVSSDLIQKQTTRREMLRGSAALAGSAFLAQLFPGSLLRAATGRGLQTASPADRTTAFRTQMGATPIKSEKLTDNLTLLSGPGGNVVVLTGPDGKFVVDNFVAPAWPKLKEILTSISNVPVKYVIDTHWHFDHTDNNAPLHAAGATVLAHENTKKRMSKANDIPILDIHFDPSPADALPQQTFASSYKLQANGETLDLQYLAPAHTDSDIYVHFEKANVIHMGDTFFNRAYPFVDPGSSGKVKGMIAAADKILAIANNDTKIVPGHGPLGNKADLTSTRDMLLTAVERVEKFKAAGKPYQEAVIAKPLADLDATWVKGFVTGELFVQIIYLTL